MWYSTAIQGCVFFVTGWRPE